MKNLVFLVALVLLSTTAFAQKVNFSGSWKFNSDLSLQGDQFSLAPNSMGITHTKKILEVERNNTWEGQDYTTNDVFTLDGKECENPGFMTSVKISTATYDRKAKKLTILSNINLDDGTEVEITEEMTMDEERLVVNTFVSSTYGDMSEKFVFDKQ